jgi:hypothetical protein
VETALKKKFKKGLLLKVPLPGDERNPKGENKKSASPSR